MPAFPLAMSLSPLAPLLTAARRCLRGWVLAAFVAWQVAVPAGADAPPRPSDVASEQPEALALPALPENFTTEHSHGVHWAYPESAAEDVQALQEAHPALWSRIGSELGAELAPELRVRVARGPQELQELAPEGAPPPAYATGVAYPRLGLILLSMVAPESWLPPDLEAVYTHELSHIALHRATGGQPVPRWFSEGLAIYQAKEQRLARVRTLWEATVSGSLLPLRNLDRHFPARPHEVNIAYAQSGDLVQHLLSAPDDRGRFRRVIRDLSEGQPFEEAFEEAYYVPPHMMEKEWRAGLEARFTSLPLVLSGGALWGLLAMLLVWAFVSKRRRDRRTLRQWAEQEAVAEAGRPAQVLMLPADPDGDDAPGSPDESWAEPFGPGRNPHHTPAPGVPTVEHDGRHHTLH